MLGPAPVRERHHDELIHQPGGKLLQLADACLIGSIPLPYCQRTFIQPDYVAPFQPSLSGYGAKNRDSQLGQEVSCCLRFTSPQLFSHAAQNCSFFGDQESISRINRIQADFIALPNVVDFRYFLFQQINEILVFFESFCIVRTA